MARHCPPVRPVLSAALCVLLAACGGGTGDEAAASGGSGGVSAPSTSGSGAATVSWLPPVQHTDESQIAQLAGYRIYRGTNAQNLALTHTIPNPGITTHVIDGLARGTHYFAVSAYLSSGAESDLSAIAAKTIH